MHEGDPYEFGFDESPARTHNEGRWTCPACDGSLQATRLETRCRDCGLTVDSERGR